MYDLHYKVFCPRNAMSSLYKYIFFLFSIAIKRIVCIASTTQTIAYIHTYNCAEISRIFLKTKQFAKDSQTTLQSKVKK